MVQNWGVFLVAVLFVLHEALAEQCIAAWDHLVKQKSEERVCKVEA
jgi:hypothetical protein